MINNWRQAIASKVFLSYLWANIFGLVIAILPSLAWPKANLFVTSLNAYALGIAAPLMYDLLNSTPQLDKSEKATIFFLGSVIPLLYIGLFLKNDNIFFSLFFSVAIAVIVLFIWGGVYAKDKKMDVSFPDRAEFDNSARAMTAFKEKNDRDVDI